VPAEAGRSNECGEVACVASASGSDPQPVGALLEAHGDWIAPLA